MKTIEQVESQLEEKLSEALRDLNLLPKGYKHCVRLHGKARDKKRTADFEKNWSPESDSIHIRFEVAEDASAHLSRPTTSPTNAAPTSFPERNNEVADPLSDLIRALNRAESRPGYDFVSLKWFRDAALPSAGFPWATSDVTRQNTLRSAIEKRLILTSKVPNPKSPQFPVTTIRLNRLLPEVKTILGSNEESAAGFHPVKIRGEDLSATILRERR